MKYFTPEMRYLAAKGSRDGQDIYIAVLVAKLPHQVEIVGVSQIETGLVTESAPLSPARPNKTDAGRTKNRRVELVER